MKSGKSLSSSVADGVAWMLAMRVSYRVLGLVSTVVLARLLTPADFGIVAIAMSIFALLELTKNFGFDTVIIQMEAPQKRHYDTAWTFNLIFGILLAIIFILSAGFIAELYETPDLGYLIWTISSLFIISGFESVGTLDFRKNLTFEKEFRLKIIPKLIGVSSTLILAYLLRNYWSLTIGTIVTQISAVVIGYWMHTYRPRFDLSAAKELFSFSKWLLINNLAQFLNNRAPELIIGKLINPQATGIFAVSNEIGMMITTEISAAVSRASYPGYAKVARKREELKALYLNVLSSSSLLLFPVAFGFYSVADLVVPIFLGDQWLAAIPIMKLISIGGLLIAINSNSGYVFLAIGNPRMSTLLGIIRMILFIPLLFILVRLEGLVGSAWAVLYTTIPMFFITSAVILRYLPVSLKDLISAYYRPFVSSVVMAGILTKLDAPLGALISQDYLQLLIKVILGVLAYVLSVGCLWYFAGGRGGAEAKVLSMMTNKLIRQRLGR